MSSLRKIYKFLASLKLAVIVILSLAVILGTATYYEAKYDAKTAAHLVYGSPWFSLFLFMLGVNVLCAASIRYPWKKHQTGFVIVHLGIITILVGSFITRSFGIEGMMSLAEGEQGNVVTIDRPMLSFQMVTAGPGAPVTGPVEQRDAEFRWNPPSEGHEVRIPLADGLVAVVDRYIHSAQPMSYYRAMADGKGDAAIHVQITAGKGAPLAEGKVMADEWLALGDPDRREVKMGPATLTIQRADTAQALETLLKPATPAQSDASNGVISVDVNGHPFVIAVAGNEGKEVAVDGTPYRIRVDRFLPYAVVKNDKLTNRSDERVNPAVEFTVLDDKGEAERHIAFARYPEFSTAHHQQRATQLKVTYSMEDPSKKAAGNGIAFIVGPDGQLYDRIDASGGASHGGAVKIGEVTPTGWRMNLNYTVLDYLPHAESVREFREWKAAKGKDNFSPAIRLRIEGADQPGPYWLQQGDLVTAGRKGGRDMVRLRYHLEGLPLGFNVKLTKFVVGYDPGTRTAATYTSDVHVEDPRKSANFDAVITMNEPLVYDNLTFFQASFSDGNGGPQISTFQVARDPGVPVKYLGCILLVSGIAIYAFGRQPRNKSQGRRARADDAAENPQEVSS